MRKRIAVVGSGISGLVSASILSKAHQVSLFEANSYLGGHTATIDIELEGCTHTIDTGFVVFNQKTYPNFCKLLNQHQIPYQASEMSFSFHSQHHPMIYNGHGINQLFADRRNFFRPGFYRFIQDILRFNKEAKRFIQANSPDESMHEFVQRRKYSQTFIQTYLVPMIASIWSKKVDDVYQCSAKFLMEFFDNHGLLNAMNRPQWYTISGGAKNYIPYLTQNFKNNIHLNTKIEKINRFATHVELFSGHDKFEFDEVILAVHSDQALAMLGKPTLLEENILSAIRYTANDAILHTDTRVLPRKKLAWASWNYYDIGSKQVTLTYYMNRLQNLKSKHPICLSINLEQEIAPDKIIRKLNYAHPCFDALALSAQKKHATISNQNRTHYCGAYWGYGFHEDGVKSALQVCKDFGVTE